MAIKLTQDLAPYRGEYIAVIDGKIVSHSHNSADAYMQASTLMQGKAPVVIYVPPKKQQMQPKRRVREEPPAAPSMMNEGEGFQPLAVPSATTTTEQSTAEMLHSQFSSKDFEDAFAATELREHEIYLMAGAEFLRELFLIKSTTEADIESATPEERPLIMKRLEMKNRIMTSKSAIVYLFFDAYGKAFVTGRKSLKRQSRHEGVVVGTSGGQQMLTGRDIGFWKQLQAKAGFGDFQTVYAPKKK